MDKRTFLVSGTSLAAVSLFGAGCTTTGTGSGDPVARRKAIDADVDRALSELYRQVQGSEELVKQARGTLVFPSLVAAGLGVGGAYGEGALREGGKSSGYYRKTIVSVGLLAGAQSTAVFYLFMTEQALAQFKASRGWQVGVDAGVTVLTVGANARVDTRNVQQPIVAFVLTNAGLMANASVEGARISRIDL